MTEEDNISQNNEIIIYTSPDGVRRVEVLFQGDSFWLSQRKMGELFDVEVQTINYHIKEIYSSGELDEISTIRKIRIVQLEAGRSVNREIDHYHLDVVIAVGYRVNSYKATQFRIWATQTLREFIVKGFVLDDDRLKLNRRIGPDYFHELLERIREIRASERRFYQQITDIYEQCSIDYSVHDPITRKFFATVQNKLHWAITKMTAAEIIQTRANANKKNMGLTTWKNAPNGKILRSDIVVAKNYLSETEISELERIVSMFLDYAENQAARQIPMKMKDWVEKLDAFLQFNEYDILRDAGRVSSEVAKSLAEKEYEQFRIVQDKFYESDFDRATKRLRK